MMRRRPAQAPLQSLRRSLKSILTSFKQTSTCSCLFCLFSLSQKKGAPPTCIDGWRVAYRTEFPERAKTKDVKNRPSRTFAKFDKEKLAKKFKQPASRHRAFNKDAAKQKCARAKVRAKVVKRMRAIRAEAKADAA